MKVQYPGVAEAVETDLRNAMLLLPLVKRLAPGLDAKALAAELRERIGEELDYELEAQNQRRVERAVARPSVHLACRAVDTALSTRRVLVSEFVDGERFEAVASATRPSATATARSSSASSSGCSTAIGIALGDPASRATTCCARTVASRSSTSA